MSSTASADSNLPDKHLSGHQGSEFTDPRLVDIYDTVCALDPGTQPGFYLGLAMDLDVESIVDIGCGTGWITNNLARLGFAVTGLDPAPLMLARARSRKYADRIEWRSGSTEALQGITGQDLAIMTGHVAQFFIEEDDWTEALANVRSALRPGGWLAFESRNPLTKPWQDWQPHEAATHTHVHHGPVRTWSTPTSVREDAHGITLDYLLHYHFVAPNEKVAAESRLRFRSLPRLSETLEAAGFGLARVYGDWDRTPFHDAAPELIIVAQAI